MQVRLENNQLTKNTALMAMEDMFGTALEDFLELHASELTHASEPLAAQFMQSLVVKKFLSHYNNIFPDIDVQELLRKFIFTQIDLA